MRAHDVPAVIFLPVHFIGRQRSFSREALTHLLARVAAEVARHPDRRSEFEAPLSETGLASVLQPEFDGSHEAVLQAMGNGALDEPRAALVPRLAAALGVSLADIARHDPFLDWAQVSEMSRAGVAFGGHGAEHKLLGRVAAAEALDEIQTSKGWLDEKVNEPVPTFAYPNGDYTDSVVDMVKAAGYRLAFTTVPGFVRCDDDRHRLRRLNIHEHATASTPMFMARVLGLF
jgi:peptidoglycan/xylan/chitin deacetylase (PgdA/CDA1 family)